MKQPLDIESLEALAVQFSHLAEAESEAQHLRRRRRLPRRPARSVSVAIVAALTLACSAGAATLLLREGPPLPSAPAGDFSADQLPLPQTARLSGVQTTDLDGGPPWGVRVFSNAAGAQSFTPGRIVGGKLGVISDGAFRELPLRGPGTCVRFKGREVPLGMASTHYPAEGKTVIYGVASPLVRSIAFDTGLQSRTAVLGEDGAYIAVFEGEPHVRRIITFTDGTQQVLDPPRRP